MLKEVEIKRSKVVNIFKKEWFQITLLTLLSISAPLIIKSPQILVGSIVNFVLFYSAKKFSFKKTLPSIFLPSLIAYSSNILFKGATPFLLYFIPIIFVGNGIYVLLSRYVKRGILSVLLASICKALLLYIFAFVLVKETRLPEIFLSSMGVMQLITGLIGGVLGTVLTLEK
ncbi:TPA: hypothetical protein DEP90_00595 [Patescibacteria group bacterium]|nr:hypothetical protein [Patescibacteria group bacterium]